MVYLALSFSVSSSNKLESILSMLIFGLGTLPVLFFLPLIGHKGIIKIFPGGIQKALLALIGFILVLRGLGLGIPYLSPKIEQASSPNAQPKIECCEIQK